MTCLMMAVHWMFPSNFYQFPKAGIKMVLMKFLLCLVHLFFFFSPLACSLLRNICLHLKFPSTYCISSFTTAIPLLSGLLPLSHFNMTNKSNTMSLQLFGPAQTVLLNYMNTADSNRRALTSSTATSFIWAIAL